jgi:hypothetical protein
VVAAALASFTATALDGLGIEGGRELRALVFLTIAATVVVLGGGAPLASRLLRVRVPGREGIVILGAEELGLALGRILRRTTESIVFADNNPEHSAAAESAGFQVVFGNALERHTAARLRLERARTVIGLTTSAVLNHLFAEEAGEQFGVPERYVAADRGSQASERLAERSRARVLFDRPKDVERWNVRLRHGLTDQLALRFGKAAEEGDPSAARTRPDAFLLLAAQRDRHWAPMHRGWLPQAGDRAIALVHSEERAQAEEALAALGWEIDPAPAEATPEAAPA